MPSDWWPSSSAGSLTGLACELFSNPWAASSLQSSDLDLAPALYSPHPQPHYHHKQQHVPSVVYHRFCLPTFGSRSSAYWLDSSGRRCLCLYIHASRQATLIIQKQCMRWQVSWVWWHEYSGCDIITWCDIIKNGRDVTCSSYDVIHIVAVLPYVQWHCMIHNLGVMTEIQWMCFQI